MTNKKAENSLEEARVTGLFSDSRDTIEEEWRDIPGYEGQYQASSYGRIRSLDRTLMYKPSRRRKAYETSKSGQLLKPIGNKRTQYQAVFLNGNTAYRLFMNSGYKDFSPVFKLPSTSPANAAWKFDRLFDEWSLIKHYLSISEKNSE